LLLLLFCVPWLANAQTASISGTVTDATAAVVPQAKVTARNLATNASRDTVTDGSGSYRIPSLDPGMYDVLVERQGFKTVEYSRVELTVGQVQNLSPTLVPSATPETVTVHGEQVAPLDLDDAQVGNLVKSQQIENLPMILRDPYQLILLSPGAIQGNSILQGLSVNGSRERNNNFLLDGTDNNDADIPGLTLPQPGLTSLNPDSVQEFRVITSNFLPEFGRNTGAVIDVVSKRGTNEFHSDAYWFGRYDALGARDYFNHQVDTSGHVAPKDAYSRNTFGVSAGGPLVHNNTFWFANYDGERFDTTLTNTSIVPTQGFKTGVFTVHDPTTGTPIPIDLSSPENIFGLPLDPVMQKILALYPSPNGPSVDDVRGQLFYPSPSHSTSDNVSARVDHNFSQKETLAVRYTFNRYIDPNFDHTDFLPGLGGTGTSQRRQNATLQLTSVVDPRLVNSFRLGANRINFPLTCSGLNVLDSLGLMDPYGRGFDAPLPGMAGFGCLLIVDRDGSKRFSGTYTIGDDVTWARGRHTFKFGVETRDAYSNSTNGFYSRPTLDFNNFSNFGVPAFATQPNVNCTLTPQLVDCLPTLQNMVWSLLGTVGSVTQAQFFDKGGNRTADDLRGFRQKDFGAFAQDTFKILPNLTLNYGLRYQFNGVPYEVNNLLSTLFGDPSAQAQSFTFTVAGRNEHGLPPLYSNDWHDFEPRVGIAWDPSKDGKTSIRAGYGIFHDRLFGQLLGLARGNPPFQQVSFQQLFGPPNFVSLSQLTAPPSLSTSSTVYQGAGDLPFIIDPHLRMPYSQSWNFGIQRDLPGSVIVELNYVGSKGTRLLRLVDGNPPQPALLTPLEAFCVPSNPANQGFRTPTGQCDQSTLQFNSLWFGLESGQLPADAVNNNAFLHAEVFNNAASSTYHAFQANLTKRMSQGLTFQAAYTWAHAIDNSSDPLTPSTGNQGFPRNSLDLGAERGNADFDVRQRLVINYSWAIPLGHGHDHLAEGAAGTIFGGWEVAGITTFSGGLPYDIFSALDTAHTGQPQRAEYNPAGTLLPVSNPRTQTGPNLGLFSDPAWGSAGNLGRNHFYGPGVNSWDMVLQKTVRFSERANLQFRTESYNLFNRVQFSQPDNLISDTNSFGQSSSQVRRPDLTTGARQIQFGVKLSF
jgi:hypothetical protein